MKLLLDRKYKKDAYTIGNLYIDNEFFCNTLEDKDRGLNSSMSSKEIKAIKISNETAIPTGTYTITLNVVSPKYSKRVLYQKICNGKVPRLLKVPGFEGILMHIGNTKSDTSGCILVGQNTEIGKVLNSTNTFINLYKKLSSTKDDITITIQ